MIDIEDIEDIESLIKFLETDNLTHVFTIAKNLGWISKEEWESMIFTETHDDEWIEMRYMLASFVLLAEGK